MMKKYICISLAILSAATLAAQGYQVTFKAPQVRPGITYLTYWQGKNLNIADSAAVSANGTAVFKGPGKLFPGIYVIVFPGKQSRVELLVDKSQQITVTVPDTLDIANKTVISGAPENVLYTQYQKFVAVKGRLLQAEKVAYAQSMTKTDSALHEKNYNAYTKELNDFRENIIKSQPNSMMAVLLNAMKDPKLPPGTPVTHQDSIRQYYYYRNHYWDGVSFMDDRIVRTPFFVTKLERYYREVMPNEADSIIKDADYKLLLARSAPEMYKFLLNWLTDEYINPKYMGMDAVFVHLFDKYHSKGLSSWLNEKQMETISRRAYMVMSNLIGEKGANLEMLDRDDKPSSLYDLQSDYTVLCFWDPNCGHCKEEVPRLDSIYRASWKNHSVKIYAVLSPDGPPKKSDWLSFIDTHHLGDWTHVYQTREMEKMDLDNGKASFRQLYDVILTPTLYLLDSEKRIIGKKLTWQQLNDFLEVKWKQKASH